MGFTNERVSCRLTVDNNDDDDDDDEKTGMSDGMRLSDQRSSRSRHRMQ